LQRTFEYAAGQLKRFLQKQWGGEAAFRIAIAGQNVLALSEGVQLQVLRGLDIPGLDGERRISEKVFETKRTVYDETTLRVRHAGKIVITDCVFMGDLWLDLAGCPAATVDLDTCVIKGRLYISGNSDSVGPINLTNIQARVLSMGWFTTDAMSLSDCRFAESSLASVSGRALHCSGSEFGVFKARAVSFESTEFPAGQVSVDESLGLFTVAHLAQKLSRRSFDPFVYPVPDGDRFAEGLSDFERASTRQDTIRFLLERSGEQFRPPHVANLRYAQAIVDSRGIHRAFVVMTGGFIRPWIFMLWSVVVILAGALGFVGPDAVACSLPDATRCGIGFGDALMLSGVTFTTIGYGTPTPVGWHQAWAVVEGVLGILLSSSFVVSLTRRYIN
jgi:hypothetical protein